MKLILKNVSMLLCLMVISGCSQSPKTQPDTLYIEKVIVEKQYPDPELLKDCPIPELKGKAIKHKLIREKELEIALKNCNVDKAALRDGTVYEVSSDEQADSRNTH